MKFSKYHALGNDYLVLDPADAPALPDERAIRLICHRNFGLGSDGILYGPLPSSVADVGLRIYNPDGSEAEKSGNGLRIFSRYLVDIGRMGEAAFTVETPGGVVECVVDKRGLITVEMGTVTFSSEKIPVQGPTREVLNEEITVGGETLRFCAASIGNPHCVLTVKKVSAEQAHRLGPLIETEARFPRRTNVQFLEVIDRANIRIEIWERGAGYTLASGSSSSAAGAVAKRLGLVDEDITVHMPGGQIQLHIDVHFAVRMTGPATRVAKMIFDPGALNEPAVR
ncbi:MAG: diaminopimelate epimerase [Opitutales bacterium]|nr:diaminopimelate epimerase [Opitutales bacterium]